MKLKRLIRFHPAALLAVGVFLGRGAYADTTLTFDSAAADCAPPQQQNPNAPPGITNFGNFAAASSGGVTVSGFGTPNIGLRWGAIPWPDTRWEYYNTAGTPWAGVAQLQGTAVGTTEELTFFPNNPSAAVTVESFRFDAYYVSQERFTYDISVVSGTNVLQGPTRFTFLSDATKNHLVNINYTGTPGQTLKLKLHRVPSTLAVSEVEGNQYNNAVDDIAFAQTPATTFPAGPQVISTTPVDDASGLPATSVPAYTAIITNGPTLSVANPIQLQLDHSPVSPPPTITSLGGGLTSVTWPGASPVVLSSGSHMYTLTYADNAGGFYTNDTVFVTTYTLLPPAYALPPGSGVTRGYNWRLVSAYSQALLTALDDSIARAVAQLNGTLINPNTSQPYTNDGVLGPNPDGSYSIDTVLNFDGDAIDQGNFANDTIFPGIPGVPASYFSTEALLFLDLPTGYYRFGVNSDDGFEVNAVPPEGGSGPPIVLGLFDGGRGPSDTLFDIYVPTSGVYPFQVIYFQGTGHSEEEFFSVTDFTTGVKALVNNPAVPNAIKSYRVLRPHLTRIVRSGPNAVVDWAYGTPPFQLQFKNSLADPGWTNIGAPTSNRTASVPIQPGAAFIRVVGQ